MTDKIVFINGEFNDTDILMRYSPRGSIVKRQFTVYYDEATQLNILKIESGETDKTDYKGRKFNILKVIRIPLKNADIINDIEEILWINIKRES